VETNATFTINDFDDQERKVTFMKRITLTVNLNLNASSTLNAKPKCNSNSKLQKPFRKNEMTSFFRQLFRHLVTCVYDSDHSLELIPKFLEFIKMKSSLDFFA